MPKRIFVSFAIEDQSYRDLLVGQSKLDNCPFEFMDMSVKEPWKTDWKDRCRTKIKGCDGMIVLLSRDTPNASGAKWEVQCAREERIPILAVYVSKSDRPGYIPTEMQGITIVEWTWEGIRKFIDGL